MMNLNQSKNYLQKRVRTETGNDFSSKRSSIGLSERANYQNETNGLWILANAAFNEISQTEDRLEYLKTTMPSKLINSFNTREMKSLKSTIDDVFLAGCQLRTSAVPKEVMGSDKVYQFFESYLQGCPDVKMTCVSPMQFNVRVISFMYSETGRSNFNVPDELFDYFKHGSDRSSSALFQKCKGSQLRKLPISFTTTSYVNFILNKELTHVEKYIHTCKGIVVKLDLTK